MTTVVFISYSTVGVTSRTTNSVTLRDTAATSTLKKGEIMPSSFKLLWLLVLQSAWIYSRAGIQSSFGLLAMADRVKLTK